ncbi:MAG: ElaB/YqjD/DUF883 family membrane-anchored ribosome-binding protein [Pirellulaceae bacterium]
MTPLARTKSNRKKSPLDAASPLQVDTPLDAELENAASQVQAAREALTAAQEHYEQAREQAAEKIEELRDTTVGELVDGVLEFVKKNPAAGVFASGIIGFIIGRISKR